MIHKFTNRNGFTLIEILASIVLLTVVISLFLSTFPQMGHMNQRNGDNLKAANVGKELLVDMKKLKYGEVKEINNLPLKNASIIATSPNTIIEGVFKPFNVSMTFYPSSEANIKGSAQSLFLMKIEIKSGKNTLSTTYGYLEE